MRALLNGLWEAETWSLRAVLFCGAVAMLSVTFGYLATGPASRNGIAAGLAGSVGLLTLALRAQQVAERRGTPERMRRRREE